MPKNLKNRILGEVTAHYVIYILLTFTLILAFYLRVYRVNELLQFYYDQGRDALVIWRLWHEGKPFLIGPVTGLAGIFLGPFYYYLLAPFYLIGGGDPVYPAVFLAFLSTLAILVAYILGARMHSRITGLIAATIGAFSYYIFTTSRWLSNPNPILLSSMIFLWSLWEIVNNGKKYLWIVATLMMGISLQFESASAFFYLPLFLVFTIWQRRNIPERKYIAVSFLVLLLTILPQMIFNFRHENILFNNFKNLFLAERAFKPFTKFILEVRSEYFWSVFSTKLFPGGYINRILFVTIAGAVIISSFNKFKTKVLPLFVIFLVTPMVGYILFQGNFGNIYDYYMSGYYLPFILLFSLGMGELWQKKLGVIIVGLFFYLFLRENLQLVRNYLTATVLTRPIAIDEQVKTVDWVFDDAKGRGEFNVDVYVPPVIPYAYDYLFLWRATKRCGESLCGMVKDRQIPLLYTLYEPDNPNPDRLQVWFDRQKGIGVVEEEARFGQITIQRRKRL